MNPITATLLIGVASLAVVSAQQANCGCAPQPTIIQLSCGKANQGPYQPPAPPPFSVDDIKPEDIPECDFDQTTGLFTGKAPGGFPDGVRIIMDENGEPKIINESGLPTPPENWDGNLDNMGFPMPPPRTPHFNMLTCLPIRVAVPVY